MSEKRNMLGRCTLYCFSVRRRGGSLVKEAIAANAQDLPKQMRTSALIVLSGQPN